MPHLDGLRSEVLKTRQDVQFFAINVGDPKDVIEKYFKDQEFSLQPVMQEGHTVSRAFGVRAYPTNYVIGPDGKVLWRSVGWDKAAVQAALEKTAGNPPK